MYHFALYDLIHAVKEVGSEDAAETLETLVQGKRLKDIYNLPLDLSVQLSKCNCIIGVVHHWRMYEFLYI